MAKRRGPYAVGSPQNKRFASKADCNVRLKKEVVEFLKIGGDYHGVGFQTYLQWLLERALLEEIKYYGWGAIRPVVFDQQQPTNLDELHDFLHLSKIARRRERTAARRDSSDDSP